MLIVKKKVLKSIRKKNKCLVLNKKYVEKEVEKNECLILKKNVEKNFQREKCELNFEKYIKQKNNVRKKKRVVFFFIHT